MRTQSSEYFKLSERLKDNINIMLQEIQPDVSTEAINLVNEYIYDKLESNKKLHIFYFKIQGITRLSDWNYIVEYTLHEHASTAMANITQIGTLMLLKRPNNITQTDITDGYLFSTNTLEDVINIYEELGEDDPLIKNVELNIDTYDNIENIETDKTKYINEAKKMLNKYKF